MKILFLLHFPPPVHGSSIVGLYIKESGLINENYHCQYINLGTSRSIDEIGKKPFSKVTRYANIIVKTAKNLFSQKPDLCYYAITAKGSGFYKDALIIMMVKLFRVKLVYHFHNKGVKFKQDNFIDNLIYSYVFRNSSIIMLSPNLYPDIRKYVSEQNVFYCPNGITLNVSRINKKNLHRIQILFLSNLLESKGLYILIEACGILINKGIAFHCNFVGREGDVSESYLNKKIKDSGLNDCLTFHGSKYGKEKEEIFMQTDIFVHPTFNDCYPLVLLEAMQHSIPVVSTFEGGIPDIVDDGVTGFLVQQKNALALAEKLEILINDPTLRQSMGKAGRAKYEREYTLDVFENRLKSILDSVLDKT